MGGIIILAQFWLHCPVGKFQQSLSHHTDSGHHRAGRSGFADDYIKAIMKKKDGIPPRGKLAIQFLVALGVSLVIYNFPSNPERPAPFYVPFINEPWWIWAGSGCPSQW
jgi:UDP-N-acetylmuramyl pentapeptide phosphotransferase/UDP-N-acetylglucosamine-1-phosphate transferase